MAFIALPKYQASPLLDLSPIAQALQARDRAAMQERQFAEQQRQFNLGNQRADQQLAIQQAQANQAAQMAPLQLQALRERLALDREMAPLQKRQIEAQIKQLEQKDAFNSIISNMFSPAGQSQSQAAQPQGGIQPQSFNAPGPNTDPMLIPTQAGGPQQPQAPVARQDMVKTPLGPRTDEEARRMGFGLALAGKGDAGKMLVEAADANKLEKAARTEVDKAEINATNSLARLDKISAGFDPKFLTLPEQARQFGMSWKAWLGASLPKEQVAAREKFVTFKQDTIDNLNRHIQAMTGAAMGVEEAKRIIASMPNMNSDPIEFKAALDNVRKTSASAIARSRYLRMKGFTGRPWEAGLPLEDMPRIIDQRAGEIEQQLRGRVSPERMRDTVKRQLKQEFGI